MRPAPFVHRRPQARSRPGRRPSAGGGCFPSLRRARGTVVHGGSGGSAAAGTEISCLPPAASRPPLPAGRRCRDCRRPHARPAATSPAAFPTYPPSTFHQARAPERRSPSRGLWRHALSRRFVGAGPVARVWWAPPDHTLLNFHAAPQPFPLRLAGVTGALAAHVAWCCGAAYTRSSAGPRTSGHQGPSIRRWIWVAAGRRSALPSPSGAQKQHPYPEINPRIENGGPLRTRPGPCRVWTTTFWPSAHSMLRPANHKPDLP
jgi:hypothetical protein